ncbi:MAG: hypothetical protein K940chlam9_00997 [Chlamydiae bacterium]|nr:hypothetical protein [Chlamydiota bacterium]
MSSFFSKIFFGSNAEFQPLLEVEEDRPNCSRLEEEGGLILDCLMTKEREEERSQALLESGKRLLKESDYFGRADWHQFALMHNASLIENTQYEGGNILWSVEAWEGFFAQWKRGRALLSMPEIGKGHIEMVLDALVELREFAELRYFDFAGALLGGRVFEGRVKAFRKLILSKVEKRAVYVPMGYRHGIANVGHAIIGKFEKQGDNIVLYLLNQGDGASLHPPLSYTTAQERISYSYYPIVIPIERFQGEVGLAAFFHYFRLHNDAPHQSVLPYSAEDLYDIFIQLGEVRPDLMPSPEKFEANTQDKPKCSEKAVKNVVRNLLKGEGISDLAFDKMTLHLHLCSLVSGYHTYCRNQTEVYQKLLHDGIKECGFLTKKLELTLPREEKAAITSLLFAMRELSPSLVKEVHPIRQIPPPQQIVAKKAPIEFPTADVTPYQTPLPKGEAMELSDVIEFPPPTFRIETFMGDLERWTELLKKCPGWEVFPYFYDCIYTIPVPHPSEEEDVWNRIEAEEVGELVDKLRDFFLAGTRCKNMPFITMQDSSAVYLHLSIYTIYAVIDKLARQNPETKLEGFASPFFANGAHLPNKEFFSLPYGAENVRYSQIRDYFRKTCKNAKGREIFPVAPALTIRKYLSSSYHGDWQSQGASHIAYLQQFFHKEQKPSSWGKLGGFLNNTKKVVQETLAFGNGYSAYLSLWQNREGRLPKEVMTLYYFAFLSYIFFEGGREFPRSMEFEEGYDDFGEPSLLLNSAQESLFSKEEEKHKEKPDLFSPFLSFGYESGKKFLESYYRDGFESCTTNDAVCARLTKEDAGKYLFSEATFRDLLRISRKELLRVPQAMQWLSSHYGLLANPRVRMMLEHCFFSPGGLTLSLQEAPSLAFSLREVVQKGFLWFQEGRAHHTPEILFLIRLGVGIEEHIAGFQERVRQQEIYAQYKVELEALLECKLEKKLLFEVKWHWVFVSLHLSKWSKESLTSFFRAIFSLYRTATYEDLYREKQDLNLLQKIRTFLYLHHELIESFGGFSAVCTDLLGRYLSHEKDLPKVWEGVFPVFVGGDYKVDFSLGRILHSGKGELRERFTNSHTKEIQGPYWLGSHFDEASDGNVRVQYTGRGKEGCVEKRLIWDGDERWARKIPERKFKEKFHFELQPLRGLVSYILYNPKEGDPAIVCYDPQEDVPYCRVDYQQGKALVTRLDSHGNRLPWRMVNLCLIEKTHQNLFDFASRFQNLGETTCFINERSGEVEEISFHSYPLSFVKTKKGLESREYPGYVFAPLYTLKEIRDFPPGLVLRNEHGEGILLLPKYRLQAVGDLLSRKIEFVQDTFEGIFHYTIDPFDGTLFSSKSDAMFYLTYLLKSLRDYEKAHRYLNKVGETPFVQKTAEEIFLRKFTKVEDSSPESVALDLKFFFFLIERKSRLEERIFEEAKEEVSHYEEGLFKGGIEVYSKYLHAISKEELSSIPLKMRLSKEEEKTLLFYLQRRTERCLPQILRIRLDLLTRAGGRMGVEISPREVSLYPPSFSKLVEPKQIKGLKIRSDHFPYGSKLFEEGSDTGLKKILEKEEEIYAPYPIRLTRRDLRVRFPELYEIARSCEPKVPHPFDFTLLTLLKVKKIGWQGEELAIASLLFYVRYLPKKMFCSLSLADISDTKKAIETFNKVVDIVSRSSGLQARKGHFPYTRSLELQYPQQGERLSFQEPSQKTEWITAPFSKVCNLIFSVEEIPSPSLLPSSILDTKKKGLAGRIYQDMQNSAPSLEKESQRIFSLKKEQLEKGQNILKDQEKTLYTSLQKRRGKLLSVLNATGNKKPTVEELEGELSNRLDQESQQFLPILPETVMKEVILRDDLHFLRKHRPSFPLEKCKEIAYEVKLYYHELVLWELAKEGATLFENLQKDSDSQVAKKRLSEILDFQVSYDPFAYPEINYFKVKSGKLPRAGQLEVYLFACEALERGECRLFQLPAGGGKTSYVAPLLMLRAKRKRLLPIFCSTQAIYSVDKANLDATLGTLEEKLALLEVGMHMKLTAEDLKFIFNHLKIYLDEGRELILTPQIIYAIELLYRYAALREKDEEKVKWLSLIRAFFKKRGFLLGDESHRNFDSLTRAMYGTGDFLPLPKQERRLFLDLMRPLMGAETLAVQNQEIGEISRLARNYQGNPTKKELKKVSLALAEHMAGSPHFALPEEEKKSFIAYWTDKKSPQPKILLDWASKDPLKANLAVLVGYFLLDLLPQIAQMRTELDHAPSIYPEEEFDTPCHHKTVSTAQFEDPYLTLALSIKGTYHRGLTRVQRVRLLQKLIEVDRKEQEALGAGELTPINDRFHSWVERTKWAGSYLRHLSPSDESRALPLARFLSTHPLAIDYYLEKVILPQVGFSSEQLSATPVHILNGFQSVVAFSATPYFSSVYPLKIEESLYDKVFEARVVAQYCQEKHQEVLLPKETASKPFFGWMKATHAETFAKTTVLLDPGGFFCDAPNVEVAQAWLEKSELDGVVYFQEEKSLQVDSQQHIYLLLKERKRIQIDGSRLIETLKKEGLDWEKVPIGTYYDAAHTESTDIMQKDDAHALVFGGDNLTSSHLIQAIMRLRGFLDPQKNQTLSWVLQLDMAKKVVEDLQITGETIFHWTARNEAIEMKNRVILAAFQEIAYLVEKIAWEEIERALQDPKRQISLFKKYSRGFSEEVVHNPYGSFAVRESKAKTRKVLSAYWKQQMKTFGFGLPGELPDEVEAVISRTVELLSHIPTNFDEKITKEIEQQTRVKKEMEQKQYRPRPFDPRSADAIFGDISVDKPEFPKRYLRSARGCFSPHLTENLYFEGNHLLTAKEGSVSLETAFLKPIDFFLIIHHEGKTYAEVTINEIFNSHYKTMKKVIEDSGVKHKAFLVTASGELVQKGKGDLAPSEEFIEETMKLQWFQDLTIDALLLTGKIPPVDDPRYLRLLQRVKDWPDFVSFWERIVKALPNPETASKTAFKRLLTNLKQES